MNKKLIKIAITVLFSFFAINTWANTPAVLELQKRLSLSSQYSAEFTQIVHSMKGKVVQKGSGKLQIKQPNLFRMDTMKPQENRIISDGKNLWFYDPFVAQVTVNRIEDVINNTPFILLTSNDPNNWKQYDIKQNSDTFVLKPKSKKSTIQQFDIRIDPYGLLKGFSTIEKNGQSNLYMLKNISTNNIKVDQFKFKVPKGVEVDDQRTK
ncbi:outer membrane lipoprotein chaperone LolA [Pasteurella atlantica]|uniref:outer membrane lipoprotein chaperone LolA n=1 Tax=Pasteurellaceae TaxID=712 RepID=UPI0027553532|nr:outer membrane lipoprotein chaperone LolA [Pasteurella atlantica]MDP8034308.1 outer membrane lipoprotein chaperone LolA [Pasteurella atlantica]MDP8036221.1 outer membrane lipoprotein chaperone LolA [Pasteurella atlantica]MDP8038171.1 outer membrane lipoprotein chaperone LolA [Pasteurella atlantica]MDP8048546.1 outer membrane lipoprotein chaperone LolA [Pasteurella atlantica]MDP8050482.1 outer membrane lipoprotein chaperone LolA [Pasteurella atlantica]